MKLLITIQVIIISFLFTYNVIAKNQIVADLSQENVKISTDFLGAKILLFGSYDGQKGDDIIVVVTGPKGLVKVQKKEKVFGIWVNTKSKNSKNFRNWFKQPKNKTSAR